MNEAGQLLSGILQHAPKESLTSDTTMSLIDMKVNAYNSMPGPEGAEPCPDCRGKGHIAVNSDGTFMVRECHCKARVRTKHLIYRSGLGELYEQCTLDSFTTEKPWRQRIKEKAIEYISGASGWFFICGRSGSGKTHITVAITREFIEAGMETRYFMWRHDSTRLKAMVNDWQSYDAKMKEFSDCQVLLIDDLWKGGNLSDADISLTYELLNARNNAPSKLTLISTEWSLNDILRKDEAIGGRIYERAKGYVMQTQNENYRLMGGDGT